MANAGHQTLKVDLVPVGGLRRIVYRHKRRNHIAIGCIESMSCRCERVCDCGVNKGVSPNSAVKSVATGPTNQFVIAFLAVELIITPTAKNLIIPVARIHHIG